MLIVDNRKILLLIILSAVAGLNSIGCATKQGMINVNSGKYELNIRKSGSSKDPVIYGRLMEYKTKDTIFGGIIKIDHKAIYKTDAIGKFEFPTKAGKHIITGGRIGYYWVNSKTINAIIGDTIQIDLYLKQDTTPLVD